MAVMAISTRYLFSELLVISRGITFNKLYQGGHNVQVVRTLYGASALGLDKYISVRERVQSQFGDISDRFRIKMKDLLIPNSTHMVFTEDLKNMLHLVEPGNKEDLDLVMNMIKQYNKQTKEMRFGTFTFGPVIMRMLHFLNEPSVALEAFKNPDLSGFFDQVTSFHLIMDLLYTNKRYQDVLDVFDIMKNRQLQDSKFPRNAVCLVIGACYKMNTPESLKYTLELLGKLQEFGHVLTIRAVTFAAALALNQNSPHISLEILSTLGQFNHHVVYLNVKIAALADVGRPEDALPILRNILQSDDGRRISTATVSKDACEKLRTSVETSGNQDCIREFEELVKQLIESEKMSNVSLDDLLTREIGHFQTPTKSHNRQFTEASFNKQRQSPKQWSSSFKRPGLRDLD